MIKKPKRIMIVPSNDIKPLNQLSNTHTLLRCNEALRLWKTNGFDFIVTSGGLCYNKKIETIPAADIIKNWLVSKGILETQIISENKSLDTYTNIHFSLKLLKDYDITLDNLAIISHWTHLARIKTILWRNYKIKPVCYPVEYKLTFTEWLHEIFCFFYHFLDKTGNGFMERNARKIIEGRASS